MDEISAPAIGKPLPRVDGPLKVTGTARYSAEFPLEKITHGVFVRSSVARGRITGMDTKAAEAAPGVVAVFSHLNLLPLPDTSAFSPNEDERSSNSMSLRPLSDPEIVYNGQYVALVVAETLEQARLAGSLVRVSYDIPPPLESLRTGRIDNPPVALYKELSRAEVPDKVRREPPERGHGDAEAAFASAAVRFNQTYTTPWETHNPMEPHATTAVWDGDNLLVYDATQNVSGLRRMLATAFKVPPENVHVVSKFVGGAFGCKGLAWPHVALTVAAARAVRRPVKVSILRHSMFTNVGYRSPTIQRLRLGANRDGTLVSIIHSGFSQSALNETYIEPFTSPTASMYATSNIFLAQKHVRLNVCRPTFMRAPGEVTGMFALECAMDELAHELKLDPIEIRLRNYAEVDPLEQRPFSSKSLRQCYTIGAEKFGWEGRKAEPGAVRDGRWLVGYGVAGSMYPVNRSGASAKLTLFPDGSALAQSATHELGTGTYTALGQFLAELLGIPAAKARFDLGDSLFPDAPVSGGSQSVSSVGSAIAAAVAVARDELLKLINAAAASPLRGAASEGVELRDGRFYLKADPSQGETLETILRRAGLQKLEVVATVKPSDQEKKFARNAFGVHFCEVRVDPLLGTVRVGRWVSAHSCGRILNEKTAQSQIYGGIVMGIGMALMEETIIDERWGRLITDDLADYHVPVHADVPTLENYFVEETDTKGTPIGTKGIGEIGIVGAAAAVANAVFNATGRRIRDLPITPDKLML